MVMTMTQPPVGPVMCCAACVPQAEEQAPVTWPQYLAHSVVQTDVPEIHLVAEADQN